MSNHVEIVSTEKFWRLMCTEEFARLSRLSGVRLGVVYMTLEAPEDVDGFIDDIISGVKQGLDIK